jgi:ABC-type transport system involved in multi-copper enzyme maturation permease subunit
MVQRLIVKDWYLLRWAIAGYLAAGAVGLFLLDHGGEEAFYAGCILLITVLIAVGMHLAMATVVLERTEQTLPFVMSLPISPTEYTTAKILANLLIFLVPWLALLLGAIAVIAGRAGVPDGLIPFVTVVLGEIFTSYALLLAVAVVSESQAWTIGTTVVGNLGFQAFLYYVSHLPGMAAANAGPTAVWSASILTILAVEAVTIVAAIGITFWLQGRKKDFL